jgi:hypothetical protein
LPLDDYRSAKVPAFLPTAGLIGWWSGCSLRILAQHLQSAGLRSIFEIPSRRHSSFQYSDPLDRQLLDTTGGHQPENRSNELFPVFAILHIVAAALVQIIW